MEFLHSFLSHHFEWKQWWHPEISLPNTPSHWWFSKHFYIFSNFSHFTGVFYSSKSSLAVCGLSGHYGSWSYKLLCHQVHWSGERWLSLCRVFLMAKSYPAGNMSLLPYPRPNLHDVVPVACFCYRSNLTSFWLKFFFTWQKSALTCNISTFPSLHLWPRSPVQSTKLNFFSQSTVNR